MYVLTWACRRRAYGWDHAKRTQVDLLATIVDNADHHFLPTIVVQRLPPAMLLAQISNILHEMPRPRKQAIIFVVHGHNDEQSRSTR